MADRESAFLLAHSFGQHHSLGIFPLHSLPLNCFLNRMQSFTQMSYETGVTICGSITCRAVSYEPGRLFGAGSRDLCIANTYPGMLTKPLEAINHGL